MDCRYIGARHPDAGGGNYPALPIRKQNMSSGLSRCRMNRPATESNGFAFAQNTFHVTWNGIGDDAQTGKAC